MIFLKLKRFICNRLQKKEAMSVKEKKYCGLCLKESSSVDDSEKICDLCSDLLEFGYPSYPAYPLDSISKKQEEVKLCFYPY